MTKAFGARFVGVAGIVDFVDDVAGVCLSPNPIAPSRLGLSFSIFKKNNCELGEMRVIGRRDRSSDTTWTNRLYRRETVRDHFNELEVLLEEVTEPHRRLGLVFRAYNEGAAFRYFIPEQEDVPGFELMRELTGWRFPEQRLDRRFRSTWWTKVAPSRFSHAFGDAIVARTSSRPGIVASKSSGGLLAGPTCSKA